MLELFPAWGTVIGALLAPDSRRRARRRHHSRLWRVSARCRNAKINVAVGVGTLAGSTIMLLTIAWFGSMAVGRCDLNEFGEAIDGKSGTRFSLMHQGVSVDSRHAHQRARHARHLAALPHHPGARLHLPQRRRTTTRQLEPEREDRAPGRARRLHSSARSRCSATASTRCSCRASRVAAPRRRSSASTRRSARCTPPRCCTSSRPLRSSRALRCAAAVEPAARAAGARRAHHRRALAPQGARRRARRGAENARLLGSINEEGHREAEHDEEARRRPAQPHVPQLFEGGADDGGRARRQWPSSPTRWST
jgi:hypothetical protein